MIHPVQEPTNKTVFLLLEAKLDEAQHFPKSPFSHTLYNTPESFQDAYANAYQHTSCFYSNTLYNRMTAIPHRTNEDHHHTKIAVANESHNHLIKQEPNDKENSGELNAKQ